MDVAGRVALVTGSGMGTGRAIAVALAERGAHVVASDIDEVAAYRTARECGGRAVVADLLDPEAIGALLDDAAPQILVNNAGGGGHIPPHFPDATPEQWGAILDLNLRAPMLATQAALAHMDGEGVIVNVASSAALGDAPYQSPEYGAANAGLIRFTTALASVDGVRVNCIVPDWVATERLSEEELASDPPPIPLDTITRHVLALIADDEAKGRAVVIDR